MTLDEAIIFAEQVAYEQDELYKKYNDAIGDAKTLTEDIRTYIAEKNQKCSENHHQLAEWLKDYRRLKEKEPCDKCVYSTKDGCCQYDDITETIPPFEPYEDAISRQAVLDVIEREQFKGDAISEIEKLPPVTPQPKTGHWEKNTDGLFCFHTCSCCGNLAPKVGQYFPPYCPECGARMAESEE